MNADCKEPVAALPGATVVASTDRLLPPRLLVLDQEAELLAFDPATGKSSTIDQDVAAALVTFTSVHELSAGRVIIRDVALKHPRYFGTNVTRAASTSWSPEPSRRNTSMTTSVRCASPIHTRATNTAIPATWPTCLRVPTRS